MFRRINVEYRGDYCIVALNEPETLNALSGEMVSELTACVEGLEQNGHLRAVVLTGTGKSFVAGADIKTMCSMTPVQAHEFAKQTVGVYEKIESSRLIYIAAINGYALGGGLELALACDLRVAAQTAKMGLPECELGIIPGGGGTQRLPRLIGEARAKELIFTCDIIDAETALRYGIINHVAEPERLLAVAAGLAGKIQGKSGAALMYSKRAIQAGGQMPLYSGIAYEGLFFGLCFATRDQFEGMTAFIEKRSPDFTGK